VQRDVDEAMEIRRQGLLTFEQLPEPLKAHKPERKTLERTADVARRSITGREAARRALGTLQTQLSFLAGTLDAADFAPPGAPSSRPSSATSTAPASHFTRTSGSTSAVRSTSRPPGGNDDGLAHPTSGSCNSSGEPAHSDRAGTSCGRANRLLDVHRSWRRACARDVMVQRSATGIARRSGGVPSHSGAVRRKRERRCR
jgi:hypothetical protein